MRRGTFIGLGVLLILVGGLFTLQGVGAVKGSAMSNVTAWAIIGPIIVVIGILLAVLGLRLARTPRV